jgi:hypothetical protein
MSAGNKDRAQQYRCRQQHRQRTRPPHHETCHACCIVVQNTPYIDVDARRGRSKWSFGCQTNAMGCLETRKHSKRSNHHVSTPGWTCSPRSPTLWVIWLSISTPRLHLLCQMLPIKLVYGNTQTPSTEGTEPANIKEKSLKPSHLAAHPMDAWLRDERAYACHTSKTNTRADRLFQVI